MPITIQNSAGGGVTLDSTTSSNETLQLPSGGGTLAPLASPVFTDTLGVTGTANSTVSITAAGTANDSLLNFVQGSAIEGGITYDHNSSYASEKMIFRAGNNTAHMTITGAGNVDIGSSGLASEAGCRFYADGQNSGIVSDTTTYGPLMYFGNINASMPSGYKVISFRKSGWTEAGTITMTSSSTAYNTSSDYRLKTDVQPMTGATDRVKLLKPCNFEWISDGTRVDGFLAHEAQEVVPEAVHGTKDAMKDEEYEVTAATDTEAAVMGTRSVPDMQGIDQSKLVPLLTATIQELISRIETLENV